MKSLLVLSILFCFKLQAEVSRSPAVIAGLCDLDISTTKINSGSEKVFTQEVSHKVMILSDDSVGCSAMPEKQYPRSTYEEHVRNEMKLLFQKYPENFSKRCDEYFKSQGLKKSDYACEEPSIASISFKQFGCEKKVEDGTGKISFAASADAAVRFHQRGVRIEEKSVELVQKEECARVNECMEQAQAKDLPELRKLKVIACKNEVTPIASGRAPAIEKDSSFNGKRLPKSSEQELDVIRAKVEANTIGK